MIYLSLRFTSLLLPSCFQNARAFPKSDQNLLDHYELQNWNRTTHVVKVVSHSDDCVADDWESTLIPPPVGLLEEPAGCYMIIKLTCGADFTCFPFLVITLALSLKLNFLVPSCISRLWLGFQTKSIHPQSSTAFTELDYHALYSSLLSTLSCS